MQAMNLGYRVAPAIDNWLDNNPEKEWGFHFEPKISDDAWHPSGDCTPSVYDLWLKATGQSVRKPISVSLKKTFGVGHYYHQWIQWILTDELKWCKAENVERRGGRNWGDLEEVEYEEPGPDNGWGLFPKSDEPTTAYRPAPYHWATGSADVAPLELPDDTLVLFDIKSMASSDIRANRPPARFVDKWESQLAVYLDWFPECEYGLILGVGKDSPHQFAEYKFHKNPELVETIYNKWKFVSEAIDLSEDVVPEDDDYFELPLKGPIE